MFIPTPLLCLLRTEQAVKFFSLFLINLQKRAIKKLCLCNRVFFVRQHGDLSAVADR